MIKKADVFLAVTILIATVVLVGAFFVFSGDGETVTVTVDGVLYKEYSLNRDITEEIVTDFGSNTLCIKDGRVSILEADCPDGYCVSHIDISRLGETVVCLPHRLVVEIRGDVNG